MGVVVGAGVSVGSDMAVVGAMADAVGVAVGAGTRDVQEDRVNINRKSIEMNGVILFRMGCILTEMILLTVLILK
jgi:hypothetical protein